MLEFKKRVVHSARRGGGRDDKANASEQQADERTDETADQVIDRLRFPALGSVGMLPEFVSWSGAPILLRDD